MIRTYVAGNIKMCLTTVFKRSDRRKSDECIHIQHQQPHLPPYTTTCYHVTDQMFVNAPEKQESGPQVKMIF